MRQFLKKYNLNILDIGLILITLIILLCNLFFYQNISERVTSIQTQSIAKVSKIKQSVKIRKQSIFFWINAAEKDKLYNNDFIFSGNDSGVHVYFSEDFHLELNENTIIKITKPKNPNTMGEIKLLSGDVKAHNSSQSAKNLIINNSKIDLNSDTKVKIQKIDQDLSLSVETGEVSLNKRIIQENQIFNEKKLYQNLSFVIEEVAYKKQDIKIIDPSGTEDAIYKFKIKSFQTENEYAFESTTKSHRLSLEPGRFSFKVEKYLAGKLIGLSTPEIHEIIKAKPIKFSQVALQQTLYPFEYIGIDLDDYRRGVFTSLTVINHRNQQEVYTATSGNYSLKLDPGNNTLQLKNAKDEILDQIVVSVKHLSSPSLEENIKKYFPKYFVLNGRISIQRDDFKFFSYELKEPFASGKKLNLQQSEHHFTKKGIHKIKVKHRDGSIIQKDIEVLDVEDYLVPPKLKIPTVIDETSYIERVINFIIGSAYAEDKKVIIEIEDLTPVPADITTYYTYHLSTNPDFNLKETIVQNESILELPIDSRTRFLKVAKSIIINGKHYHSQFSATMSLPGTNIPVDNETPQIVKTQETVPVEPIKKISIKKKKIPLVFKKYSETKPKVEEKAPEQMCFIPKKNKDYFISHIIPIKPFLNINPDSINNHDFYINNQKVTKFPYSFDYGQNYQLSLCLKGQDQTALQNDLKQFFSQYYSNPFVYEFGFGYGTGRIKNELLAQSYTRDITSLIMHFNFKFLAYDFFVDNTYASLNTTNSQDSLYAYNELYTHLYWKKNIYSYYFFYGPSISNGIINSADSAFINKTSLGPSLGVSKRFFSSLDTTLQYSYLLADGKTEQFLKFYIEWYFSENFKLLAEHLTSQKTFDVSGDELKQNLDINQLGIFYHFSL